MGERQKGRNDLQLASLKRDRDAIVAARAVAERLVGDGDGLDRYPSLEAELGSPRTERTRSSSSSRDRRPEPP